MAIIQMSRVAVFPYLPYVKQKARQATLIFLWNSYRSLFRHDTMEIHQISQIMVG